MRSKDLGIIGSGFGDSFKGAEFKINGEGYGAKSEGFLVQRFRFKANGTWCRG